MQLGMIGLGRMGANMVRRLMRGGHECVVWDVNPDNVKQLASEGAAGAESLNDFIVWNCGKPIQGRNRVMNGSAILSALRIQFPRRPLLQRDPHPTLLVRIATVSQPP